MRVYKPTYSKPLPEGAKVFSRKHIKYARYKDHRGQTKEVRLTKSCDKILCEVRRWHIQFEDSYGIKRQVKGYTNKNSTERLKDNIQKLLNFKADKTPLSTELQEWIDGLTPSIRNELIKFELIDAQRSSISMPLTEHVKEFGEYLEKKERNPAYIKEVTGILKKVFRECGFERWSNISAAQLKDYLDGLRDAGRGVSKRRYNGLLGTTKLFCRWMVKQQKATSSPVEYLDGLDNQQTDRRHPRRVLDINELRRFLEAALTSKEKIYGLTGYERNLLYRIAIETGLRSVDIRRLRVKDIDFTERKLTIRAARTKNKTDATVYLKPATAVELKQYCKNKLPDAAVIYVTDKTAPMIRFDLVNTVVKDANNKVILKAITYVNEHGEYFDFHALRHQCASLLALNPETTEAVRQQALRHKTPEMTRRYSHTFEQQQREAIESMPDLTQPSKESQATAKTGTDDRNFLSFSCVEDAQQYKIYEPMEKQNFDNGQITHFHANNKRSNMTTEPKVGGSNPSRRSC